MAKPKAAAAPAADVRSEAGHRAKDPGIVARSQKLFQALARWGKYLAIGLIAIALIYFLYVNAQSKKAETAAQAVQETTQATRAHGGPFTETITVLPGKRAYVPVREGYTAFYECDDWGNVEIPGSRMMPKDCGPRPSQLSDQWGDVSGVVLTFTTAYNRPLHVTVTQIPVK